MLNQKLQEFAFKMRNLAHAFSLMRYAYESGGDAQRDESLLVRFYDECKLLCARRVALARLNYAGRRRVSENMRFRKCNSATVVLHCDVRLVGIRVNS